jgi:hypothetical protein
VAKALCYKPEGCGFETSRPNEALGFTQPLTKKCSRNIKIIMLLGSKMRQVRRADSLAIIYKPLVCNVGSLTSHKPIGLHGLLWESFIITIIIIIIIR